jgi:hypothetical protein
MKGALRDFALLVVLSLVLVVPRAGRAELGDCLQPTTATPTSGIADVLTILRSAVGHRTACDAKACICDCDLDGRISIRDAVCALRYVISPPLIGPFCDCPPVMSYPCTSLSVEVVEGSVLDLGWTGALHDSKVFEGTKWNLDVVERCSTSGEVCRADDDCPASETCDATCNCVGDALCELTGPVNGKNCRNDLSACESNADCVGQSECAPSFGPPQPLGGSGTPICMQAHFDGPVTGTADTNSGESSLAIDLSVRFYYGIDIESPCPRCGGPEQDPSIGDEFVCQGGPRSGDPCTVDGVTDEFGGTSFDCPSNSGANFTGAGLSLRLGNLTTGATARTATLQCTSFDVLGNPTVPDTDPKCTDRRDSEDPVCASNADCRRCTLEPSISCSTDLDCTGNGTCAEAPDQPITCGFWCHCGFCDNDPGQPCFDSAQCADGTTCVAGSGATASQARPNECYFDGYICGSAEAEFCETTEEGTCSGLPFACADNADCASVDAGECETEPLGCFEPRISRSGSPSPLGVYCAIEDEACTTNADCPSQGDVCVPSSARPESVALFCNAAAGTAGRNATFGFPGPAALHLKHFVTVCYCGDSVIGCSETCDDGNVIAGDGCDPHCQDE